MRGVAALALSAAALVACGSGAAKDMAPTISLKITYWVEGVGTGAKATWTVRCNPAGGTIRSPLAACRKLAAGGRSLFAPVPRDVACTQIYGGPQVARVVGTLAGRRIWASFRRTDGCQISRWDRVSPWLLPSAAA